MKIASHVLYFNQDKWILKHIEMVAPFVDKIYVAWSEVPWTYNPEARKTMKNTSNPDFLKQSPYYDKIELIKGTWDLDEEERNACLDAAKRDGMDYLLIIDADEFYKSNDLANIVEGIKANPDFDIYNVHFAAFWKDLNHVIIKSDGNHIISNASVAINVNSNNRFTRCRNSNGGRSKQLPYTCWHASYALTDAECWSKINSWGHAHQFNKHGWFNNVWKSWTEDSTDLHPITPHDWYKAIPNKLDLPEILNNNDYGN
mgnify:CR=1 FL=1